MGMSTHVVGLRSADNSQYRRMIGVVEACAEADVPLPDLVQRYFGSEAEGAPADWVLEHHLEAPLEVELPSKEWGNQSSAGVEVAVSDIPSGVTTIRFYNSW